ncbi:MAG: hypothetical protein U5K37_08380 [Natrialbaceae archaeon]|nr:hypothetical protein [Natrialbaceae archaeon]
MASQSSVRVLGIDADRLPLQEWRLDALFSLLGAWLIIGVTWDFGKHAAGIDFAEEGFLTAPHVTFYSAAIAIGVLVGASILVRGQRLAQNRGPRSLRAAVPEGYTLAILGLIIFGLGGPLDYLWHMAFGAEAGVEALVSPTHLTLATGAVLF